VADYRIESWSPSHPRWHELVGLFAAEGQLRWVLPDETELRPSTHVLAALVRDEPVGFLAFIVQEIGPADGVPPLGLTEAKVLAFGVSVASRGRGIGTALQRRALERARELGCYQVRSVTDARREENVRVKIRLGFGAHPTIRHVDEEDRPGYVFVRTVG
jgi:GNAT superfamily N-acetyltransferase